MDLIQILANLGLPSAIVCMVIIAWLFRKQFERWAKRAVVLAIILALFLGLIQLANLIIKKNISIICTPEDFYTLSRKGKPQEVKLQVQRGEKTIATKKISALDEQSYKSRLFSLKRPVNPNLEKYLVMYESNQQGELNYMQLTNIGWKPTYQTGGDVETPRYWFTHKVFLGQTHNFGDTGQFGELKITFEDIRDKKAVVYLILSSRGTPFPEKVDIANKQVSHQDFAELPTFYIAVREADFRVNEENPREWAAFSIFLIN